MRRLRAQNRDSESEFGGSRIADLSRRVCAGACFLTLHNEFFEKRNSVKQSRMAGQPRSRSQMAMRAHQDDYYEYDDDFDQDGDDLEHQLGGMTLQELQARERAHRRAGGEMPVGGMPTSKNYTFSNNRMGDIGRENQALLQRLQRIAVKGSGTGVGGGGYRPLPSSQAVNRARKEKEIARQNLQIANRLMNAKSATFDSKKMKQDQANQEKYLRNASQFPVPASSGVKPKKKGPARPPWFKELPSVKQMRPQGRPEWQD